MGSSFDGSVADTRLGLFTVGGLETGTVFTLGDIDLGVGVLATVDGSFDAYLGLGIVLGGGVVSAVVREFDVEMGGGLFGVRSKQKRKSARGK